MQNTFIDPECVISCTNSKAKVVSELPEPECVICLINSNAKVASELPDPECVILLINSNAKVALELPDQCKSSLGAAGHRMGNGTERQTVQNGKRNAFRETRLKRFAVPRNAFRPHYV